MGELSGRLREDSKKYRKAAVRINWELLVKQVSLFPRAPMASPVANCLAVRAFRGRRARCAHLPVVAVLLSVLPLQPLPNNRTPFCMNVRIVDTSR